MSTKIRLLVFVLIAIIVSCNQSNNKQDKIKRLYAEKQIPEEVINFLLKKIELSPLKDLSVEFEMRRWGPFLNDSFPITMRRIFWEDQSLKGEIYFFSTQSNAAIESFKDMPLVKYDKIKLGDFSKMILDSIVQSYNLFAIQNFDTSIISNLLNKGHIFSDLPMVLNEQNCRNTFISIFSRYPRSFVNINNGYKFLDKYQSYTDSLILKPDSVKEWYNKRMISTF